MIKKLLVALVGLVAIALVVVAAIGAGWLGRHQSAGTPTRETRAAASIAGRMAEVRRAARAVGDDADKQILFGDLHVHTTFSTDAFFFSLPQAGSEGAHPPADACDFARFCSALDFWSINDHAESLTPQHWRETVESIRQCNDIGRDTVAFLGWEWTQSGFVPEEHFGHKNVVLAHLDDDRIPARPIAAKDPTAPALWQRGLLGLMIGGESGREAARYFSERAARRRCPDGVDTKDLPTDCHEVAPLPSDLFRKLDEWGHDSIVIPHGTSWGVYTPQGSSFDKQLSGSMHDDDRQTLFEVYSGHGDSESYRDWEDVVLRDDGPPACPPERPDYLPMCRRAGQIVRERCLAAGEAATECEARADRARLYAADAGAFPHMTVPAVDWSEWADAGQCRDCQQPAFYYRPRNSAQYTLAIGNFERDATRPRRFRFGLMASSDNHFGRGGGGYKEYPRFGMTESLEDGEERTGVVAMLTARPDEDPLPHARLYKPSEFGAGNFSAADSERIASYLYTGGLVAVHARSRERREIWDALQRREVYGTSGPRILLWFDLKRRDGSANLPMGSEVRMTDRPEFVVRAVGSFEQIDGCPEDTIAKLAPGEVARLCKNECYNPSERRRKIARVDVIRIRPQQSPDEKVADLIEDPWKSFDCAPDPNGCVVRFADDEFPRHRRDTVYYVRVAEEPAPAVNGKSIRVENGEVRRCPGPDGAEDLCLGEHEPRAWSSPIFVDYGSR